MSEELKVGDVVRLKSGGEKMTIEDIDDEYDVVVCVWFMNSVAQRHSFNKAVLVKSEPGVASFTVGRS